jgi:hypothetical protein
MRSTEDIDVNVESGARHESGHIVIAASQGLTLRAEGLMVDPFGWGLACYYKDRDESDQSREQIIVATLAGFAVEKRFREERSYPARDYMDVTLNRDNVEARTLLTPLAGNYASHEASLNNRLQDLIGKHWPVIEALAVELLAKEWEPLKPLKSGGKWSHENASTAKYVTGEEAVRILAQHRIAAVVDPRH